MTKEEMSPEANAIVQQYAPAPGLDLSKIKNLNASKSKGNDVKVIEEQTVNNTLKAKKSKFCFTEEHEVELPTRGLLYQDCDDEDIKKGIVRLRPMSLADEEILANQSYVKNGTVFTHLLNSCMLNEFDARNFIPYDVYYLIYALRQITYGEDYSFEIQCPACEKKFDYDLKISEVEFEQLEKSEPTRKKFKLPVSKFTLDMRCSVLGDEEEVYKLSKNSDASDKILEYIVKTYEILDNKGEEIDRNDYEDFFSALPGKDRAEIDKQFENIEGIKIPTVTCTCPKCGHEESKAIPFNKEFFRY